MVTGGCGFIGAHLVELLANNNLEVISIDHKERAAKAVDTIRDVVGDVRDRTLMREIFSTGEFDCIFDWLLSHHRIEVIRIQRQC